jgi:hypothetical protein
MRIMMIARMANKAFNAAVRDGSAGMKMKRILEELKPEAVYFTEMDGQRTGIMVVDLEEPSKIPALAEPWFLTFDAAVEFHVVMGPEELEKAGIDRLGKKWA